jgi:hypothetical protein
MRNLLIATILLAAGAATAGDKKAPAATPAPAAKAPAASADKLAGEVVDITCYTMGESKGDKHASCASKCISAGMPAGIVAEGKLYLVTMKDHTAPSTKLAALAGKSVNATGKKIEKEGLRVFELDTIEAAAAAK